ncbi:MULTISPECIES: hypothetical protein [unclassified Lentimonas]|uniref:hypothetical protein n=1 Tax=unclassified Lentimonas TaxID=2630993 RepID=UPI0013244FA3|nr:MULTISPECIES: hypothetical protein [unclassified Lentimonas]CAA6676628.1 Unannotated [Lentimonas sp. CC4]CAA6684709.1 Unannotated [Lentimonas sp. CC6]CAA7075345.1 Unannotated [Lentimonas sp. CC4]CAA7170967.1 Unannotated [Lentimonas sp. CC21]CAA7182247.1 Unannotated [Lentimonas sp. CC8]
MKTFPKTLALLSGVALLASSAFAQSVATDPVGYVTVPVKGGGTSIISNGGLLQPISTQGVGSVSGGVVLTVSGASYVVDEFAGSHYVQVASTGEWAAVASNSADTITLEASIADGTDLSFTLRPLNTLDSLFGADNSAGFTGGADFGASDKVFVWGLASQNFVGFYYYNSVDGEWQDVSNNPATVIIYPDEALIVVAQSDFDLTFTGSVQTGAVSAPVAGGGKTSILPNPYSVDLKISESGYESVLNGAGDFGSADKLFVWSSDAQNFSKFYYYNTDDSEWQNVSNATVTDDDVIPVGGVAVVVKASAGDDVWSMAQPF